MKGTNFVVVGGLGFTHPDGSATTKHVSSPHILSCSLAQVDKGYGHGNAGLA